MTTSLPAEARDPESGFLPVRVYQELLGAYPSVADLVRRKAIDNGDRTWLTFQDGRSWSYREADEQSDRLAAGFASLGVAAGHHVAIFAFNSPEWLLSYFALLKLGAVPVTVNTAFVKEPLVYNLTASDASYAVVDARLMDAFREVSPRLTALRGVVSIGPPPEQALAQPVTPLTELLAAEPDTAGQTRGEEGDCCAMILTSGTTGPSKVVAESNAQFLTTALFIADAAGIDGDSVLYVYLPLFHIMALDMATLTCMVADAEMVLTDHFSAAEFWFDVKRYGVSHFHAVGPILEMLFKQDPVPEERDHGPLTAVAYCSAEIWNRARERFGIAITGGYGSTEVGIPVTSPRALNAEARNPPGSCGRVGPHVEAAIMDDAGRFLAPGRTGEIVVRPRLPWAIFREYYRMPEKTVEAFRGLWFHTGDAGVFDDNGFLYFADRLKDSIRRRGENISSYEIEQILLGHGDVREAAAIPVPSDVGDDEVMAVIVPTREALTAEAVIDHAGEHMPRFWVPRYVRFVGELPHTPTGRVEKYKLKDQGVTPDTRDMGAYAKRWR